MTEREQKIAVKQSILSGKSQQETFDALRGKSTLSDRELADFTASIPSLQTRKKYKTLNTVLITLFVVMVLINVFAICVLEVVMSDAMLRFTLIRFVPKILLFVGFIYFVANYSNYKRIAILISIGIIASLINIVKTQQLIIPALPELGIIMIILGICIYLGIKIYPISYEIKEEKHEDSESNFIRINRIYKFEE